MKFENTKVFNFEGAIRGARNPMNSWDKSDSYWNFNHLGELTQYVIGPKDMELAQKLIRAGSEHRKFLRQIFVSVDITAPEYFFKELDTYKVGVTANSTSTMHRLATTPITIDCFETDDCDKDLSFNDENWCDIEDFTDELVYVLEELRQKYNETKDKRYWKELVRWLPMSWLYTRTVTMSYENIFNMIHQRKNHRLNEWSGKDNPQNENFIKWARSLPYAQELLFIEEYDEAVKKLEETKVITKEEVGNMVKEISKENYTVANPPTVQEAADAFKNFMECVWKL